MVVLPPPCVNSSNFFTSLHLLKGPSSNALVGSPLCLWFGIHFHSSHQHYCCHNKHGTWTEHNYRVHYGYYITRKTNCQCVLQSLWLYEHVTSYISFLSDFKLGHYMKIPPRSMFLVQLIGTVLAGTINIAVAWWLLNSVHNICQDNLLPPDSPWTCPGDRVFFDASVIWGLAGPKRIFGDLGPYKALNWFFFGGAVGPVIVWLFHKAFPKQSWIPLINLPVLFGATSSMPPATTLNYNAWIIVGTIFNLFIFHYRKLWWQWYNYILSAALDAGVAFMTVLLYLALGVENKSLTWWGTDGEHCNLATCPTAKGIVVDGCPIH